MRINVYAEELPNEGAELVVSRVMKRADTGRVFFGARLYLKSANDLHYSPEDDDRSAITIWGPRAKVAKLLWMMAREMERTD